MGARVLFRQVVAVVGREQRDAEVLPELLQHLIALVLDGDVVVLDLEVVAVAEDLQVLGRELAALRVVVGGERAVDLAREAAARRDEPAVQLPQEILVDARLEVEALLVRQAHHFAEVLVALHVHGEQDHVEVAPGLVVVAALLLAALGAAAGSEVHLASDDRLDGVRHARLVELDRAEHVAVVGHRDRRHPERLHLRDQLRDLVGAVEQTVLRVEMEMHEAHRPPLLLVAFSGSDTMRLARAARKRNV